MHCLDTIAKLNKQEALKAKPSATYRIRTLRDHYQGIALRAVKLDAIDSCWAFIDDLDRLISRIERDEKEVS